MQSVMPPPASVLMDGLVKIAAYQSVIVTMGDHVWLLTLVTASRDGLGYHVTRCVQTAVHHQVRTI